MTRTLILAALLARTLPAVQVPASAQERTPVNTREASVPAYVLPDPLALPGGTRVSRADDWLRSRRPELRELLEREMYGRPLPRPREMQFVTIREEPNVMEGLAVRREIELRIREAGAGPALQFTLILPKGADRPVPVFAGLHLFDTRKPVPEPAVAARTRNRPPQETSPGETGRSVAREILRRGYALASLDLPALCPDSPEDYWRGVLQLFGRSSGGLPGPEETGAIGVWAWGLSRALDYFETVPEIDAARVIGIGHSRMGKAALWAGAVDTRFAMIISNNSGCGGAALSRRRFGETVAVLNRNFPHWYCGNFKRYDEREADMPFDQHFVLALIAPRPLYIGSASEDSWADPKGEFLSAAAAHPVYRLLGSTGMGEMPPGQPPPLNQPVGSALRYHLRAGSHDLTEWDWERYLDFADGHLKPQTPR